jgi:hypothetical protein
MINLKKMDFHHKGKYMHKHYRIFLCVLLTLAIAAGMAQNVWAQSNGVDAKLQQANNAIEQAFNAVQNAERAGANVTSLTDQLNSAAELLATAENAYRTGNDDLAISDVDAVLPIAQQVTAQAQTAQENALSSAQTSFQYTIIISIVAAIAFVASLFFIWRPFKQSYIGRLYKKKPEVTN